VGDNSHVAFGEKFPQSEVFTNFHAFAVKCPSSMLN
jgi:hypothetical protein